MALRSSSSGSEFAVVVTGEPIESVRLRRGSFAALIGRALGDEAPPLVELDARQSWLPELGEYAGVIVTGSAASVMDGEPWMLAVSERLREASVQRRPVLGICFGHQLLAEALGGKVGPNPLGREIGTVALRSLKSDPLLDHAEQPLLVSMTHLDAILRLPAGAEVLACTELDPCAMVRFTETVWGVQFHPEMDAEVMTEYVRARFQAIEAEGLDAERILRSVSDANAGREVLRRFVRECALAGSRPGG